MKIAISTMSAPADAIKNPTGPRHMAAGIEQVSFTREYQRVIKPINYCVHEGAQISTGVIPANRWVRLIDYGSPAYAATLEVVTYRNKRDIT